MENNIRIAILSRPGPCFPNIISQGLSGMLHELDVKNDILYEGIPLLMRLLPLNKKPKRWHNNLQFRIRNKLTNYFRDKQLIRKINEYDAVILSECYPNAFWKNYFAIDELRKRYRGKIISYTESPLDAAPVNRTNTLEKDDYDESLYDYNLFVTGQMEVKTTLKSNQAVIGVRINNKGVLNPGNKQELIAVIDFAQDGFEHYRSQQINALKKLGIKTILLEGRYPIEDIRKIYAQASIFFLSFPETFGLPIAECLSCGAYIFTPESSWPMSWRINENPISMGPGLFPECFKVYGNQSDLENKLEDIRKNFKPDVTPQNVFNNYIEHYSHFYNGDKQALRNILNRLDK